MSWVHSRWQGSDRTDVVYKWQGHCDKILGTGTIYRIFYPQWPQLTPIPH